jgi:hypothetical protein
MHILYIAETFTPLLSLWRTKETSHWASADEKKKEKSLECIKKKSKKKSIFCV